MPSEKDTQENGRSLVDDNLTQREMEVLKSLAEGNSYQEIANVLFISHETVKKHLKNIYRKMNVKNKIQAINRMKS
jgi:DNA-binding CsgD family transcriptional regulator